MSAHNEEWSMIADDGDVFVKLPDTKWNNGNNVRFLHRGATIDQVRLAAASMSCPEIQRVLSVIRPESRERWGQVYDLCYRAVCTPSLDAATALDILIDRMLEIGQWQGGFRTTARARQVAWAYAARRCGMRSLGRSLGRLRAVRTTKPLTGTQ